MIRSSSAGSECYNFKYNDVMITKILKPVLMTFAGLCMFSNCGMAKSGGAAGVGENPVPGTDGNKYVPYEQRTGNESIVYFTRNLGAEGLLKAYE